MKQPVKMFLGSFHTKDLKTHAYKSRLYRKRGKIRWAKLAVGGFMSVDRID